MKDIFDTREADLIEYEDFLATIRYHKTFVDRKDVIKHAILNIAKLYKIL